MAHPLVTTTFAALATLLLTTSQASAQQAMAPISDSRSAKSTTKALLPTPPPAPAARLPGPPTGGPEPPRPGAGSGRPGPSGSRLTIAYYQADVLSGGAVLGLWLSNRIAELHGAPLALHEAMGRFSVPLPPT